jgi:DNA-binding NarL/FixJ family response regulator
MDGILGELRSQSGIEIVSQAASAAQLLHLFTKDRPDVTLIDLEFPDTDVKDVIAQILTVHPQAALIGLTTYEFGSSARAATDAGLRIILAKNQIANSLAGLIRASVEASRPSEI